MASLEREVKVEVDVAAKLEDLDALPGVVQVRGRPTVRLESTYYDSPGLRLARSHLTLRRRTGGDDAGWTLKIPGKRRSDRFEVTAGDDGSHDEVPSALRQTLMAQRGVTRLQPVACVHTERTTYQLLGNHGEVLADVADDRVIGKPLPDGDEVTWREIEVELLPAGDETLISAAHRRLMTLPGARSGSPAKLFRVLGGEPLPAGSIGPTSLEDSSAVLVRTRLAQQVDQMRRWDPLVRQELPGGVHQLRKAVRRLRDGLATARPFLDKPEVETLRGELKWLSRELGSARDAEVLEERLRLGLDQVDRAAAQSLQTVQRASAVTLGVAREALGTERYLQLLSQLDDLVASPPWRSKAGKPIASSYLPRVKHEWKRLSERVAAAGKIDDPGERAEALHECRKAAKRLRYAVEPLLPLVGKPAKRSVDDAKDLQSLLGEHHDAVVGRRTAKRLASSAPTEETPALLAVMELEGRHRAAHEAELDEVWKRARAKKRRRWYG